MKHSVLSKALGASVISLNLALLPLTLPVFAQTSTNTGNNTTSNPNVGTSPASGNGNTNNSSTSNSSTSDTSTAPSAATTDNNNSTSANNGTPTDTTSTRSEDFDWGWLGLLGLIGLAGLFYKQKSSVVSRNSYEPLHMGSDSTGDRLHEGLDQAQAGAHGLLEQIKTGVGDFQERRAQEKEIKDIKNALGRPSKRVILDKQDNVILNVGDLVTHQAIERARHADILDVLLHSVDENEPEIANEERSAPVPGEASLEEQEAANNRHWQ